MGKMEERWRGDALHSKEIEDAGAPAKQDERPGRGSGARGRWSLRVCVSRKVQGERAAEAACGSISLCVWGCGVCVS